MDEIRSVVTESEGMFYGLYIEYSSLTMKRESDCWINSAT